MPTTNVSYAFPNDGTGSAQVAEWSETLDLDDIFTGPFHETGDGNPVACINMHATKNGTGAECDFTNSDNTFEDLGVPSGATITGITNLTIDYKIVGNNYVDWSWIFFVHNISAFASASGSSDVSSWTGDTGADLTGLSLASSATCNMIFELFADTNSPGSSYIDFYFDNISFDIEYSVADETATVAATIPAFSAAASASVTPGPNETAAIAANMPALSAALAASVFPASLKFASISASLPGITAAINGIRILGTIDTLKIPTTDIYTLDADGISVPLIGFTIRRKKLTEVADIQVPLDYQAIIDAATMLTIDQESRITPGGTPTVTELFSGVIDSVDTVGRELRILCSGSVSYPRNQNRPIEDVSYVTDGALSMRIRSKIDPRFYPGDVGQYGDRRININIVTFVVTRSYSFMELINDGQL